MTVIKPNGIYSHFIQQPRWSPEVAIKLIAGMTPIQECLVTPASNDERNQVNVAHRNAISAVRRAIFIDSNGKDERSEKRESFPFICFFDEKDDRNLVAIEPGSFITWAKEQGVLNAPLLETEYKDYEDAMYDIARALDAGWTASRQAKDWMDNYVLKWLVSNDLLGLSAADVSKRIALSPETFASLTDEQKSMAVEQAASFEQWISTEHGQRGMELIFQRLDILRELREIEAMGAPTPLERESRDRQIGERHNRIAAIDVELAKLGEGRHRNGKSIASVDEAQSYPTNSRDRELQVDANALAAERRLNGLRGAIPKRVIAKALASSDKWKDMTAARIERILRVEW